MGGTTEIQIARGDVADAMRVQALFAWHERTMSRFVPESELNALNASAPRAFEASPLLFDVVSDAIGWACVTDGIFDPTVVDDVNAAGHAHGLVRTAQAPTAVLERVATRRTSRWRAISIDHDHETITLPPGVGIDLDGIGKGYTVDRAIAALGPGANALVNASGDLYAAGDGPHGEGWYIGIQDPFGGADDVAVLNVNDRGVATSGATRHRAEVDARYIDVIDRRASAAASDLASVTVVAPTATLADVLAKTASVLGAREGLRFVERFSGAAAIAVTERGDVLQTESAADFLA